MLHAAEDGLVPHHVTMLDVAPGHHVPEAEDEEPNG